MRVPWPVYVLEVAAVAAGFVLLGFAFSWVIASVFGGCFVLFGLFAWIGARKRENANPS
jgi:hypothetical protein